MFLFTIKSAVRSLLREKQNAFIILLSLTISFAFSNILITFISFEANTDSFHEKKDTIFRLFSDDPFEKGKKLRFIQTDVGQFLTDNFPEVKNVCNVTALNRTGVLLSTSEVEVHDKIVLEVDTTFFDLFNFPILEGNIAGAFMEEGIVLKESLAKILFKEAPYIGNIVVIKDGKDQKSMKVTAVLKQFYENTQFQFDAIALRQNPGGGSLFLELHENANRELLTKKINESKEMPSLMGPGFSKYELEPLTSVYFNPSNVQPYDQYRNKQLITICWVIVLLLSFTASFNFINLYVVGLMTRRKEMGIKRVLGASKWNLLRSIGTEVGLYVLVSILLSLILTYYLLPFFNSALNTKLSFSYFIYVKVFTIVFGSIALLGLFITIYLTVFTWRLHPVGLINDKLSNKVKANRVLFTVQFFITVGLVICSFVVIRQMQFIKNKPLGFNKQLMQLQIPDDAPTEKLTVLKETLLKNSQISHVAVSSGNPISGNWMLRYELEDGQFYAPFLLSGDESLVETLGLTIIEGKNVNPQDQHGKLVNETLARKFDMKDPIGMTIPGSEDHIVGVVRDFNSVSLKKEIPPYIISFDAGQKYLLIDISNLDLEKLKSLVIKEWQRIFPDLLFEYKLIENELLAKHLEDEYFYRMIISFTIASLLISCFGLYGIASFTTSRRTKEIGIRKVLGATIGNIIFLVWKDYLKLIAISYIIAVPVVSYFLDAWINEFAFKIELSWWLYVIPALFILCIVLLTIGGLSFKAAAANPVESLRNE